jgi:hypothetical protein
MTVNNVHFTILVGEPIEILSETQIHVMTEQGTILLNSDEFEYRTAQELITAIEANPEINLVSKN